MVPKKDKSGPVYQAPLQQCVRILELSVDANPQSGQGYVADKPCIPIVLQTDPPDLIKQNSKSMERRQKKFFEKVPFWVALK